MKIMDPNKQLIFVLTIFFSIGHVAVSAKITDKDLEIKQTMRQASEYMVEEVSYKGGYLWNYLPDFSRQWGEMEAYKTMIWLQHPGTISMGHLFLDAFHSTGDDYYYQAAEKAAAALIWGQSKEGGWNYLIDFAGDRSLKVWYSTIGKNGWRLEEFQHYYGNSTFDDNISSDATRFLLRMYLEKLDPKYKPALDKAIHFVLESQYPLGGWPQRYPLKYDFNKSGHADYTSFYTYNDDVIAENIHLLFQCYVNLGEERFLDPIHRGMNFFLLSQDETGAWGQQYNMQMQAVGARTYEPDGLVTSTTFENALLLLQFYQQTGDKRYLNAVPAAIEWLDQNKLPDDLTENGKYTHPYYIEKISGKPIYVHRVGANVTNGSYYYDYNADNLIGHSRGKRYVPLAILKADFQRLKNMDVSKVTENSLLKFNPQAVTLSTKKNNELNLYQMDDIPDLQKVNEIINSLDDKNRWLAKHVRISHPYVGDGQKDEQTSAYSTSFVGDETDTSPFTDVSNQEYISTEKYIVNMKLLINFLNLKK